MALALWFASVPILSRDLDITDSHLGTVLGAQGLGTVIFVVIGSVVATWLGVRATMLAGAILFAVVAQWIGLGIEPRLLIVAVFLLGATNSFVDVSMNTQGSLVERLYGREIMSTFHAAYNFGGFAGASIAAALISATDGMYWNLVLAGAAMVIVIVLAWRPMGNLQQTHAPTEYDPNRARTRIWRMMTSRSLFILGVFVSVALFVESGMSGWSGLYLTDVVEANPSIAAMAFGGFQLAMAVGRLLGSSAIRLIGVTKTLIIGSGLAGVGVLLATAIIHPVTAILGFTLVGVGLANLTPLFFSRAAAAIPTAPAVGIAVANTLGYVGYICGPLVLGFASEAFGLKIAFLLILGAFVFVVIAAPLIVSIKSSSEVGREPDKEAVPYDQNEKVS